jgi:hypothetical protein
MDAMKHLTHRVMAGNPCAFVVFLIFNTLLLLTAILIFITAILLFVLLHNPSVFNIGYLVFAVIYLAISIMAYALRRSIHLLGFYIAIMIITFLLFATLTIVAGFYGEKLITWVETTIRNAEPSITDD